MRSATIAIAAVAACQFSHGVLPATDDGGGDDGPPPPDAGPCQTLASECIGDTLRVCTAIGTDATDIPCGWGCVDGPPRCAHVIPSGSGGVATDGVLPSDVAPDGLEPTTFENVTIDGDTGRIGTPQNANLYHGAAIGIENGIDYQRRGPIAMFRFKSLTVGGTITLIGARPIALVADGAVTIKGIVDARGLCSSFVAGPGGFNGGSTAGADGNAPVTTNGGGSGAASDSGGGGGAHASAGGSAEDASGGMPYGDPTIMTLVGGAGGGAGGGGANFGRGGGGGGALQIVSNTEISIADGGINAGGCGGKAGAGNNDSGGGGGAGGTILLEAPSVTVTGTLAANGGGGGGGGGNMAKPGDNGALGTTAAGGGSGDSPDEGGGDGAATGKEAGSGGDGSNPGGGGGGIGRIRINTRNGTGATLTSATLSPGPSDPEMRFSTGSAATQ